MYMPQLNNCHVLLAFCCVVLIVSHCSAARIPRQKKEDIKQLMDLLAELDEESQLANADGHTKKRFEPKRAKACLINAGLSQGCELSDFLMAKQQQNKFSSFTGPGRRR